MFVCLCVCVCVCVCARMCVRVCIVTICRKSRATCMIAFISCMVANYTIHYKLLFSCHVQLEENEEQKSRELHDTAQKV